MEDEKELIYLNNAASTWPKPPSVLEYVNTALKNPYIESGRTTVRGLIDYPETARRSLCSLMNTPDPDAWVFTSNATDSLNLLIHGYAAAHPGKFHVVTTEYEHNAVIRPLKYLERQGRVEISVVPGRDGHILPEDISTAVRKGTGLALISHGSNVTGSVQDIQSIAKALREDNIFVIVDGAQTAGQVPIDLSRVPLDAFVFTGHKYLFGIPGIGGFLLNTPDQITPVKQGGTGMDSSNPNPPESMPERFEAGTPNFPGISSVIAGIAFIQSIGVSRILSKTKEITDHILKGLSGIEGVTLHSRRSDLGIISFNIDSLQPDDVGFMLERGYNIISRPGLHCAPWIHRRLTGGNGSVRLSLSYMNTLKQGDSVITAIREIADHADS